MSSAVSRFWVGSPSSSVQAKVKVTHRSMGSWEISSSLAPSRCFRRSIQNMGGSWGFSGLVWVRYSRGAAGLGASSSL